MSVLRRSAILIAAISLAIITYASPGFCAEKGAGKSGLRSEDPPPSEGIRYSNGRISGDFKNMSASEILKEIAKESGFSVYGIEAVPPDVITVRILDQPVEDGVRRVLRAAGVNNYAMFYRSCPESDDFEVKRIVFLTDEVNLSQPSVATRARASTKSEDKRQRKQPKSLDPSKKRSRAAAKRERRQRKARSERDRRGEELDEAPPLPFPPEDLLRGHPLLEMLSSGEYSDQKELMEKFTQTLNTTNPEELQRFFEPLMGGGAGAGSFGSPEDLEAIAEEMLSEFLHNQ